MNWYRKLCIIAIPVVVISNIVFLCGSHKLTNPFFWVAPVCGCLVIFIGVYEFVESFIAELKTLKEIRRSRP